MSAAPVWVWVVLAVLLGLSGFFSGSETALFSLSPREREVAGPLARALLARPRRLLATILLGNNLVNILFFAFASRIEPPAGAGGAWTGALGALVAILLLGEILPKTTGLRSRVLFARLGAPPLTLFSQVLAPVQRAMIAVLDSFTRVLGDFARDERRLTPEALAELLESSAERGLLEESEADLIAEIVELRSIRVREIMTPRVDMASVDLSGSNRAEAVESALAARISWLPVVDGHPDRVVGRVRVRDLLVHPDRPPARLVMPVKFVPEVASCLSLLRLFRDDRVEEAVVVDEWGGTAGVVTIEDVFEEIVGDLRAEGESRDRRVVPLGEGVFRVPGSLSIRDWNEQFGTGVVPTEFETVGGFVTALLGRIPRAGDEVRYGELVMAVPEVRGRRVLAVDMRVERREAAR